MMSGNTTLGNYEPDSYLPLSVNHPGDAAEREMGFSIDSMFSPVALENYRLVSQVACNC